MSDRETQMTDRAAVVEVRLNGSVVATGTLSSALRAVSEAMGVKYLPVMLRQIADKLEATDAR